MFDDHVDYSLDPPNDAIDYIRNKLKESNRKTFHNDASKFGFPRDQNCDFNGKIQLNTKLENLIPREFSIQNQYIKFSTLQRDKSRFPTCESKEFLMALHAEHFKPQAKEPRDNAEESCSEVDNNLTVNRMKKFDEEYKAATLNFKMTRGRFKSEADLKVAKASETLSNIPPELPPRVRTHETNRKGSGDFSDGKSAATMDFKLVRGKFKSEVDLKRLKIGVAPSDIPPELPPRGKKKKIHEPLFSIELLKAMDIPSL